MTICWRGTSGRLSNSASRRRRWPLRRTASFIGTATPRIPSRMAGAIWSTPLSGTSRSDTERDEVRTWYFEVWNEPNLSGFWEGADQKAYFELYDLTAKTIKSIDPALRVGGPSTAGAAWVPEFLAHVKQSGAAVDFVTTHTYGVEAAFWMKRAVRYQARSIARRDCGRCAPCPRADCCFAVSGASVVFYRVEHQLYAARLGA